MEHENAALMRRVDEALLAPGDEVQIGKYRMTFHPHHRAPADGRR